MLPRSIANIAFLLCVTLVFPFVPIASGRRSERPAVESNSNDWPLFYLLSVQKSGTTSMSSVLLKHPQLCTPSVPAGKPGLFNKEAHFWDGPEYSPAAVVVDYLQRYHNSKNCKKKRKSSKQRVLPMDLTPSYIRNPSAVERMKNHYPPNLLPKLRFIVILREPIARDLSWFNHDTRNKQKAGKSKHLQIESAEHYAAWVKIHHGKADPVATRGRYTEQLKHLWAIFPCNQTMVLQMDTLIADFPDTMRRIASFLHIAAAPLLQQKKLPKKNPPGTFSLSIENVNPKECGILREFYRQSTADLYRLLAQNPGPPQEPPFPRFKEPRCGVKKKTSA